MISFQLLIGLILTVIPLTELRVGLPIIINYCLINQLSIIPFFLIVIILNILVIFLIYFFLEKINGILLNLNFYQIWFEKVVKKIREKNKRFEDRFNEIGYLALVLFVAVPLPGTGAWTGTLLAWLFGFEKKKSIISISLGVLIAGLIILFFSLGIFGIFYN